MPIYNHPQYITDKNALSSSAKAIINSHPHNYWGALIYGARGRGKTAFCMHTQRECYQFHYGISYDDAWEMTLKNIMFTLEEIDDMFNSFDTIKLPDLVLKWQEDNKILCRTWDDAGMHAGKFKYFDSIKLVSHLQGNMDVLRIILTGFLINSPEVNNLLSFLRSYKDHKLIKIVYRTEGKNDYDRVARIKRWSEDKLGRWHLMTTGVTKFSCYVDTWVYEEYSKMKIKAIMDNRQKFLENLERTKKMVDKPEQIILKEMGLPENFVEHILDDDEEIKIDRI